MKQTTTISVTKEDWKMLSNLKIDYSFKSFEDLINALLSIFDEKKLKRLQSKNKRGG